MRQIIRGAVITAVSVLAAALPAHAQDLQQKLAAAKQSAAANQRALRAYTWLEKTEILFKGESKNTKVESCRYGPDGKVVKTPVVEPPPPEQRRGLRGRVVARKTGEMKEDLENAAALVQHYLPPDPDMMQIVMAAGTASLAQAGPGLVALKFPGYVKVGDALTLTFESAVKSLQRIDVATYLERPSDAVAFNVTMQSLPDGTNYPAEVSLAIPGRQIEVRITKSNYQKLER
jgi:hypothetical protein